MSKYFSITSCLILIFFSISAFGQSNTLVINEFLADNSTILQDEDGSYSDWIEIYNSGDEVVNLNGFSVTDDPSELEQWIFPDINIDSQEYLLIFASGENRIATDSELHTNFSLNKSGEFIGLFDQSGVVIDSVSFGEQNTDYSYGRIPDDISKWLFFPEPTPAAANSTNGILFSEAPKFSLSGGFYESTQQLTLSVKNNESNVINIYYTLDGTPPDHNSAKYLDPIAITNTTPVRAITIEEGKEVSHVITHTYFIDEVINLPFISLVTHPDNFFSDETGIYVTGTNGAPGSCQRDVLRNLNQDWERPVNIELFEMDGTTGLNQGAGVKIFGGCSRTRYPQKSLALFARSQYGTGDFDYQLFENKEIDSFEAFILRSSADDQVYTMFRDAFTQYSQLGFMDIDYQAYRPVVVFINGEYWGIHNLREKINDHYLADNHGVDPDAVHILENNAQVVQGSASHYNRLVDFVSSSDMNEPNRYSYVTTQMDIAQYIDYQIANIYLAENDWPGNNIKFWRADDETAKWRWLTFDKDQSYQDYQLSVNSLERASAAGGTEWPNPDWSTKLFRNLLESDEFRHRFIQSYAYHMNVTFQPERISSLLNDFKDRISLEIPRHIERWGGQLDPDNTETWVPPTFATVEEWEQKVEVIRTFSEERPEIAENHFREKFGLSSKVNLSVDVYTENTGKIYLYNYHLDEHAAEGKYFKNIPLQLRAESNEGFSFVRWIIESSGETSTSMFDTIHITPENDLQITAVFEPGSDPSNPPIIINEINYHSPDNADSGDWLEIYNRHDAEVDVSGWYLKDSNEDNEFYLPDNTRLEPGEFLVLVHNDEEFISVFPDVTNYVGSFGFNLSNGGELVRLYSSEGELINQVEYDDEGEWPTEPDGNGPTLELINYDLDNTLASSWGASNAHGTPGKPNSILVSNEPELNENLPREITLYQNYPNPFNPVTTIEYYLHTPSEVQLDIFDIVGKKIATLTNKKQSEGHHRVQFDASNLSSGIYFYRINANGQRLINKMTLIK